ncbi:hypothetical protein CEXT_734831 [Caerostris extrusa]|uniref:BPTI/Kunitz inhibitor domain-containing protein n=1 Tax=Caerostris extrusa TaxID=172846 RepID=A0AAV4MJ73_CAEEX|nr:hypothetical protein CEXT_734831 [Caerostris extrusa]
MHGQQKLSEITANHIFTSLSSALASESACDQEKVVGPCRAAFPRFFFNKQTGQCESFIYGDLHCGNSTLISFSQKETVASCLRQ